MSFRAAVLAFVGGCSLLTHPLHAQSDMQAAEQLLIPLSAEEWRKWKVGAQAKRPNFTMVEYIPKGQVIAKWDRMLTVQVYHNTPIRLAQLMGAMKTAFETKQPCERTQLKPFGSKKVNGYDTSLHWLICTRNKQNGKGEFTLMLGLQGRDALYMVQRAWRGEPYDADTVPLSEAEFKAWLTFISKVQVCDPRAPGHPCPKGLRRPDKRT